jgi:hypothetical protein
MLGLTGDTHAAPRAGYPVVQTLRLGCWAQDMSHVIAATRLTPLGVTDLPGGTSALLSNCQQAADGSWCSLPGNLGVCLRHRCDFSQRPSADVMTDGSEAGSASGTAASEPALTDCSHAAEGTPCRRAEASTIGQCLSGRCLRDSTDSYSQPLVVSDCAAPGAVTDWLNCYPSPVLGFGTCESEQCRLRCREDADCRDALDAAEVPCEMPDAEGRCERERPEKCRRFSGSYLGVCVVASTEVN